MINIIFKASFRVVHRISQKTNALIGHLDRYKEAEHRKRQSEVQFCTGRAEEKIKSIWIFFKVALIILIAPGDTYLDFPNFAVGHHP